MPITTIFVTKYRVTKQLVKVRILGTTVLKEIGSRSNSSGLWYMLPKSANLTQKNLVSIKRGLSVHICYVIWWLVSKAELWISQQSDDVFQVICKHQGNTEP